MAPVVGVAWVVVSTSGVEKMLIGFVVFIRRMVVRKSLKVA